MRHKIKNDLTHKKNSENPPSKIRVFFFFFFCWPFFRHVEFLAVNGPADPNLVSRLFDDKGRLFYSEEDQFNCRVHNLIASIRFRRPTFQPLLTFDLQQQHVVKRMFLNKLVEDGTDEYQNKEQVVILIRLSYAGYLCHIHQSIQNKM